MEVAIVTVGDEVLAGDTENTNASWLATELTERGATVVRILTIPDDREVIADTVAAWREQFDAVVVTGGLGGTHDDVTAAAIADAFDRELVVHDAVREDVIEKVAAYRDRNPELVEAHDLDLDVDAWTSLPEGALPVINPEGLCPGCVIENVYAFPGIPEEMRATFEKVAAEFGGESTTRELRTPQPEASLTEPIEAVRERFDVTVGSYPSLSAHNRVKVLGTDTEAVEAAADWLREHIEVVDD